MRGWGRILCGALVLAFATAAGAQTPSLGGRIVGGTNAEPGKWPYQAAISVNGFACGGTLIEPGWVLTAAHCTVDPQTQQPFAADAYRIRLGSLYKSRDGQVLTVERIVVHESYGKPNKFENDIALLKLSSRVATLPPARLEATDTGGGRIAVDTRASPWARVIGWGYVDPATRQTAETLQEASLPLVENGRCNQVMGDAGTGPIDARRVCAGQNEGGVDSCNGDSGGPLLAADGRANWVQVGIVSYGVAECGKAKSFGVYTRVAAFAPWIERNLAIVPTSPAPKPVTPPTLALGSAARAPTLLAAAARDDGQVRINVLPSGDMRDGDRFQLRITSAFDGYLALFDVNEKNEVTQLFPNPRSKLANRDGMIRANAPLTIPDPSYGFEFRGSKPFGRGRLIALVTRDAATVGSVIRAEDGLKMLTDAEQSFARLEVVLKPTAPPPAASPSAPQPAPTGWAAGQTDYFVRER